MRVILLSPAMGKDAAWIYSLPKSAHIDPTQIQGNLSPEQKQLQANIFAFFIDGAGAAASGYGASLGKKVKYVSMNIEKVEGRGFQAEGVCEVTVTEGRDHSIPVEISVPITCRRHGQRLQGASRRMLGLSDRPVSPPRHRPAFIAHFTQRLSCSSAPLISLGIYEGNDMSGVSQSMNIIYHSSAKLYATSSLAH